MRGNHQNENANGNEAQPDQALRTSEFNYRRRFKAADTADPSINPGRDLPRRAEERLQAREQTPQSAADAARHVHELEVHQIELERLIAELQTTLARVKQLSGLLPICASCKNIRDDQGYWKRIEAYIASHSEATFTHGICPECFHRLYPNLDDPVDSIRNLIAPFAKQPAWARPPGNHSPEKLRA